MQQRYYDPAVGRFLSVDPETASSANGGNFNRYWYGNNNPYKFVDPDGRYSCVAAKKSDCASVANYAKAVRAAAKDPPRGTSVAQKQELRAIAGYIGTEGDGSGPAITVGALAGQKLASSDQKGNWTIDVKKANGSDHSLARGAMALGHEAKHDIDAKSRGIATTESAVRTRETAAYNIQAVIGRSTGFSMTQENINAAIDGSVATWKEREDARMNGPTSGGDP